MELLWQINQRIRTWEKEHKKEIKMTKVKENERIKMMKEIGH